MSSPPSTSRHQNHHLMRSVGDPMRFTRGAVSVDYIEANDTLNMSHRSLSVHRESRAFGSMPPLPLKATFVKTQGPDGGFENEAKLHSNRFTTDLRDSLVASDEKRWGRPHIGSTRFGGIGERVPDAQPCQVAYQMTGYTHTPYIIDEGDKSRFASPVGKQMRAFGTVKAECDVPSGYSLNRKLSGLSESWRLDLSDASRFSRTPPTITAATYGRTASATHSAFTRSTVMAAVSSAPYAPSPPLSLSPTQARLHKVATQPFDYDPHSHKRAAMSLRKHIGGL